MGFLLGPTIPVDWESEYFPHYQDFVVLPFFILFIPSIRFILDRFVFEKLARRLILGKGHALMNLETRVQRKKLNKFKESAWKCIFYLSSELFALSVTIGEPWFTDTKYFWVGPEDQVWPDQKMKLKLKGYYMYAAGFYIYSIFALVFWETRRSDFVVSMGHHVATVILLVFSYIFRFARVGSVILTIHEGCDVFVELGKMSKYSGFEMMASFSFAAFVLSWLTLRLIYYPFWILWSTSYEVLLTLDMDKHMVDGTIYYYLFNTFLFSLLVIHIYWWRLMFSMLIEQIRARGQIGDDVRSDSESDDEHID
ncbi:ASC1-like protein [Cornus florida]|uniref:ASC1-like protein n=1 Tax=Cornus florida TaxID=4283 RepID=UPI002899E4E2|nr:ASC1-like protein [Cornus florida]